MTCHDTTLTLSQHGVQAPTCTRPAATPPQHAQDPQYHAIMARKTLCNTDLPQHARLATMPTCHNATNNKTHHNANLLQC